MLPHFDIDRELYSNQISNYDNIVCDPSTGNCVSDDDDELLSKGPLYKANTSVYPPVLEPVSKNESVNNSTFI